MSWGDAAAQADALEERLRARAATQRERDRVSREPLEEGRQALLAVAPMIFQAYDLLLPSWPQVESDYSHDLTTPQDALYSAFLRADSSHWPNQPRGRGLAFHHFLPSCTVYERDPGTGEAVRIAEIGPNSVEIVAESSDYGHLIIRNKAAKEAAEWIPVDLARTLTMFAIALPADPTQP